MVKRAARAGSERPKAFAGSLKDEASPPRSRTRRSSRSRTAAADTQDAARSVTDTMDGASGALRRGADALSGEMGGLATAAAIGVGAALIEAELVPGIVLGAAAMLLGKVFPQLNEGVRPLMKAAVGAGLAVADKTRTLLAEAGEQMQDVVAEVRAERRQGTGARGSSNERAGAAGQVR